MLETNAADELTHVGGAASSSTCRLCALALIFFFFFILVESPGIAGLSRAQFSLARLISFSFSALDSGMAKLCLGGGL